MSCSSEKLTSKEVNDSPEESQKNSTQVSGTSVHAAHAGFSNGKGQVRPPTEHLQVNASDGRVARVIIIKNFFGFSKLKFQ